MYYASAYIISACNRQVLMLSCFLSHNNVIQSTNDAYEISLTMLARCVADRVSNNQHELLKIVGEEEDTESHVMGFMYPCKLKFDNEYCLLISHDE